MWPFNKLKKKNVATRIASYLKRDELSGEGTMLRNELLYVMAKLELIPCWLDMGNGMKMGVGSPTPRILDRYHDTWFPK